MINVAQTTKEMLHHGIPTENARNTEPNANYH
jgi:hypothetical protein